MWYVTLSRILNVLLFGRWEVFSARVARNSIHKGGVWTHVECVINRIFMDEKHCWRAFLYEIKGRHK